MNSRRPAIACAEVLLIIPAALFMLSLFVRDIQPRELEPAHTAQQIVMWYAARPHVGLWVLLMAMPFMAFVAGCASLALTWQSDSELRAAAVRTFETVRVHLVPLIVATATLIAGGILAVVVLHVLTD